MLDEIVLVCFYLACIVVLNSYKRSVAKDLDRMVTDYSVRHNTFSERVEGTVFRLDASLRRAHEKWDLNADMINQLKSMIDKDRVEMRALKERVAVLEAWKAKVCA